LNAGGWVLDRPESSAKRVVARRSFNGKGALSDRGQTDLGRKHDVRRLAQNAGSGKAGCRQNDCVALALSELPEPCFDVAAEWHETQVRALALQLDDAPPGRGANSRPALERMEIDSIDRHEHVPWVFAYGDAQDRHPLGQRYVAGHVFEGVHREIGIAANDDSFHLAHEEAFAAHLGQWAILDSIARRLDVHLFDVEVGEVRA
jgi:hypothetical protein